MLLNDLILSAVLPHENMKKTTRKLIFLDASIKAEKMQVQTQYMHFL